MPDVKVCLVSPVPPPYGGISNGTRLMRRYAARNSRVQFLQVDTNVRWRPVYDLTTAKRMIGGGFQLLQNYLVYLKVLRKNPDVVHLKTSAELGLVRTYCFVPPHACFVSLLPITFISGEFPPSPPQGPLNGR